MSRSVYLDNHATTPVDPQVLEAMLPYFGERFGNAASRSHSFGWEAEEAVEQARAQIAALIGAAPREIVFTSGATEIGTLHPIAAIGRIAKECGVAFHCDAAQSVGKVDVDVEAMGIDLLAFTAHKLYGPKGCGVLYVRSKAPRVRLAPQMHGGGHERGLRSGTLNVPGAVGLGRACAIAVAEMASESLRVGTLRDRLHHSLVARLGDIGLNGHATDRLAGNLNLRIPGVEGDSLLAALPDVALSSGSACTSATLEPSHVLRAIGLDDDTAHSSIRFGVGRFNTEADIDFAIERVVHEVERLRALSPQHAIRTRASL